MQDVAIEFVDRNGDSLFPGIPEVFLTNDHAAPLGADATGLITSGISPLHSR